MNTNASEVLDGLRPLIGLRLSAARRAADLRNFQFGHMAPVERGSLGEYALHVQCPWRIEGPEGIVTGRSDLWEPVAPGERFDFDAWQYEDGNLQDERLAQWLGGTDPPTRSLVNTADRLVVEDVSADGFGGATLSLSGGYRLVLFPAGTEGEDWRVFRARPKGPHFVVRGGKVEAGPAKA